MTTTEPGPIPGDDRRPASADASLVVTVGNPEFQHGRTRLELDASGSVRLSNQQGREESVLEGTVAAEDAERALGSVPRLLAIIDQKPHGIPDEARYRFELFVDGRSTVTARVWESQLEATEEGRALLESLRRMAADVSERRIVL
jgi:hypothetical protein